MRLLAAAPVLAIDEVDKINMTPWVAEKLTALLDRRYEGGTEAGTLGTLLVLNRLREALPSWLLSRLADGRNRIVENTDPDIRPALRNPGEL